jgi:hypothetical protein
MKAGAIGRVTCMQKSEEADWPEILNKLDQKTNYSKKIEAIFDKIESRLFWRVKIAEEAAIELKSNRSFTWKSIFHKKLMTDLLDSDDMHDAYADGIWKLHLKNTTNKIERMKKLFNFHIDLWADGNVKRDRIVFNKSKDNILFAKKREFFFNDIFDSVSGELLSESAFISFLHKKWLWRENRTTDK